MKARNDKFDHNHRDQRIHINNRVAFVRTWTTDSGCPMLEVVIDGASMNNKKDRKRVLDALFTAGCVVPR